MDVAAILDRPQDWDKWTMAAYLRLLGASQKAAGAAIGRSERTIRNWEAREALWAQATAAAHRRWLTEVTGLARRQLLKALTSADGDLALKVLERIDTALAPATQRHKVQHEVGEGLSSVLKAFSGGDHAEPG